MSITVNNIVTRVRYCLDEEKTNLGNITYNSNTLDDDDAFMDNIIKAKIPDALRWCALYAPDGLLHSDDASQSSTTPEGWRIATEGVFLKNISNAAVSFNANARNLTVTLPHDFGRLVRVRLGSWQRAVRTPIEEDSDEYVMLWDDVSAYATVGRPVAALIRTSPNMKLECWPASASDQTQLQTSMDITYVCVPDDVSVSSGTDTVNVPKKMEPAFIYYIAFLVAAAYRESIANTMLSIAKMHLGIT